MLNDHSKASIAVIVFYVPAIILATYLLSHRHGRPRMAWIVLFVFTIVRFASGIVVISYEDHPSVGLTIAVIVLLNAGAFPLIAATIGLIRIILGGERSVQPRIRRGLILSRILFLVSIALVIAGGCLTGNYQKPQDVSTGLKLVKAGYIVLAIFVGCLFAFQIYFWTRYSLLMTRSRKVLKGMAFAMPFIIIRLVYYFLGVFASSDQRWSVLAGPIVPFLLMELLMEYAVVCIYLATGFLILGSRDPEEVPAPVEVAK